MISWIKSKLLPKVPTMALGGRFERGLRLWIHLKNLHGKGASLVNWVKGLFSPHGMMIFWLFLKSFFPDIPWWTVIVILPILFIVEVCSALVLGYWWDKNNFFLMESDWGNKRDPVAQAINKELLKEDSIKGL